MRSLVSGSIQDGKLECSSGIIHTVWFRIREGWFIGAVAGTHAIGNKAL